MLILVSVSVSAQWTFTPDPPGIFVDIEFIDDTLYAGGSSQWPLISGPPRVTRLVGSTWSNNDPPADATLDLEEFNNGIAAGNNVGDFGTGLVTILPSFGGSWSINNPPLPGINNEVKDLEVGPDGKLYVSGLGDLNVFPNEAGRVYRCTAPCTAPGDYEQLTDISNNNGQDMAIAANSDIYVAGAEFIVDSDLAQVDVSTDGGTTWTDINPPSGFNIKEIINIIIGSNGYLYVVGAGEQPSKGKVAVYDGSAWYDISPSGYTNIFGLIEYQGKIFIGGSDFSNQIGYVHSCNLPCLSPSWTQLPTPEGVFFIADYAESSDGKLYGSGLSTEFTGKIFYLDLPTASKAITLKNQFLMPEVCKEYDSKVDNYWSYVNEVSTPNNDVETKKYETFSNALEEWDSIFTTGGISIFELYKFNSLLAKKINLLGQILVESKDLVESYEYNDFRLATTSIEALASECLSTLEIEAEFCLNGKDINGNSCEIQEVYIPKSTTSEKPLMPMITGMAFTDVEGSTSPAVLALGGFTL
jgi:hypothetical protein